MVYFKTREAFFKGGLHLRALKRVGCRIFLRSIVGYGANKEHAIKLKVGSVKIANALLNHLKFLFLGLRECF
ncbi:hypothetical protein KVD01_00135 [Helicobacter pylori]|nr:hypothetical protein KVD01_00135 [Helicobacter pylori]